MVHRQVGGFVELAVVYFLVESSLAQSTSAVADVAACPANLVLFWMDELADAKMRQKVERSSFVVAAAAAAAVLGPHSTVSKQVHWTRQHYLGWESCHSFIRRSKVRFKTRASIANWVCMLAKPQTMRSIRSACSGVCFKAMPKAQNKALSLKNFITAYAEI